MTICDKWHNLVEDAAESLGVSIKINIQELLEK